MTDPREARDLREFYIDGAFVPPAEPAKERELPIIDPSTEASVGVVALGTKADTDAAVAAARRAFPIFRETPLQERVALVRRLLEIYREEGEAIAEAIRLEMGAPIDMARKQQMPRGIFHLESFLAAVEGFEFERPLGPHAPTDRIHYEPVGVCALITPWNWPMNQVTLKVVPALLAGCTVVLKPSEVAPLSSHLFAQLFHRAATDVGAPAGIFNLVHGDGLGVGTQLTTHPDVDLVSFTGSTRAGIAISKAAADSLKRVTLELGGKGANLIFADADADAVKRGVRHCFNNTGQSCNAPTRMLVERSIYERAVETAREVASVVEVGPSSEPGRHLGPLVSEAQWDRVQHFLQVGVDEGARLIAGGPGRPEGLDRGYFVRPTVFADVTNEMTIAREEIFGPVLCMIPFDTEEEALEIANDTPYGLTNYVQSSDPERCRRLARRLRSGMVEMNGQFRAPGSPFGGVKASGHGREGGVFGLEEFLEVKAISAWS